MSDTPPAGSLREQARARREQQEAAKQARRAEQARLDRCRGVAEELGKSVSAMRCALDPFEPPLAATQLEEHCNKVTLLLAGALTALREADLLNRWEQLDEPATLAHYRQQREDPQGTQLAWAHAKQILGADPTDHQRLAQLVRDAVEEPGLRGAWDWVSILLGGLTGQQRLVWKQEPSALTTPNPSLLTREGKGTGPSGKRRRQRGRPPGSDSAERDCKLYLDWKAAHRATSITKREFLRERGLPERDLAAIERGRAQEKRQRSGRK